MADVKPDYAVKEVIEFYTWLKSSRPDDLAALRNEIKYRRAYPADIIREWLDKPIGVTWRTINRIAR